MLYPAVCLDDSGDCVEFLSATSAGTSTVAVAAAAPAGAGTEVVTVSRDSVAQSFGMVLLCGVNDATGASTVVISGTVQGTPCHGVLASGDVIRSINGRDITGLEY